MIEDVILSKNWKIDRSLTLKMGRCFLIRRRKANEQLHVLTAAQRGKIDEFGRKFDLQNLKKFVFQACNTVKYMLKST